MYLVPFLAFSLSVLLLKYIHVVTHISNPWFLATAFSVVCPFHISIIEAPQDTQGAANSYHHGRTCSKHPGDALSTCVIIASGCMPKSGIAEW